MELREIRVNIWTEFNWLKTEARVGILLKDPTYESSNKNWNAEVQRPSFSQKTFIWLVLGLACNFL